MELIEIRKEGRENGDCSFEISRDKQKVLEEVNNKV